MFSTIKSLFQKNRPSRVNKLEAQLDNILKMNETELLEFSEGLNECLNLMEEEVERVKSKANDYPHAGMAGDVWFDGAALAGYGEALAHFLADKDFLAAQARATHAWTIAVLSVCAHYHHMVGPAMIANASIKERMGDLAYAKWAYGAVLQDFESILEYAEEDNYKPVGDDLTSLQSLECAATRLIELNELSGENGIAPSILERIKIVMKKEEEPEEAFE